MGWIRDPEAQAVATGLGTVSVPQAAASAVGVELAG